MNDTKEHAEKEIIMGNVIGVNTPIRWDWTSPDYALISIVGDRVKSARKAIVNKVAQSIHQHDEKAVFWVTQDQSAGEYGFESDDSIAWLEEKPDLPREHDPNQYFRERRGMFPAIYFNLVCKEEGPFNFRDLVPTVSYRSHVEGPTHGYQRAFESMEHAGAKELLLDALKNTEDVKWHVTPEGRKFIIPANSSPSGKAAAMVLALWNFWAQVCRLDQPQQFLLIIEPDKDMMLGEHESELKNDIYRALDIMRTLSEEVTMSVLLSLETMFPIPELGIRTRIFLQTDQSDIDMFTPEHQEFFGADLYEEWRKGNSHVAYIADAYTGESCIGDLLPDRIKLEHNEGDLNVQ